MCWEAKPLPQKTKQTSNSVGPHLLFIHANFRFRERKSPVSCAGLDRITIKGERKQPARPPFPLQTEWTERSSSSSSSSPCLFAPSSCQGGKVAPRRAPRISSPTFTFFFCASGLMKRERGETMTNKSARTRRRAQEMRLGVGAGAGGWEGDAPWFLFNQSRVF